MSTCKINKIDNSLWKNLDRETLFKCIESFSTISKDWTWSSYDAPIGTVIVDITDNAIFNMACAYIKEPITEITVCTHTISTNHYSIFNTLIIFNKSEKYVIKNLSKAIKLLTFL